MAVGGRSGRAEIITAADGCRMEIIMYSDAFCKVYNEFGWNYFPEAFGEQLLRWIQEQQIPVKSSLDLACGTGVLCQVLHRAGIQASGMDFSEGMIRIAKENNPDIFYEVADMISYRPNKRFDLITCTGDALNHIVDLSDVRKIFENVYACLEDGGYFVFDILNEKEVAEEEPFDLEFSDTVKARFLMKHGEDGFVQLMTTVFEQGEQQFREVITEKVHDVETICRMLTECGFRIESCGHQLPESQSTPAATWFVIAQRKDSGVLSPCSCNR